MKKNKSSDKIELLPYESYLVQEVLKNCKEKDDVELSCMPLLDGLPFQPDIYAPNGLPSLKFEGKTLVEVKRQLSFASLKSIEYLFEKCKNEYNLLVVYFRLNLTFVPDSIEYKGHVCKFIAYEDLKGKKKTAEARDKYYLNRGQKKDWKEKRNVVIKEAKEVLGKGNCVLFLGAGVGMSANMPSWNQLLKDLMGEVKKLKGETLDAFKELSSHVLDECGNSYLVMCRYLQTAIKLHDDKLNFSDLIQKHLYGKKEPSKLLDDLAKIVQQRKTEEILTYNFDDLLEQYLIKLGLQEGKDFITISKDAEINGNEMLPIYHVHGVIPEKGPSDIVVFSEEEYHKRYSNPFHWSNIEQLHALSRKHCFFIGLSMTDPNLRRLLDAARQINQTDNECHYAFLKRQKLEQYCLAHMVDACKYVHISGSLIDKKKQQDIYSLNYTVIECIFRDLGVKVIWFEDFNDLPSLIEEVFGLETNAHLKTEDLLKQTESKIKAIQDVENEVQKVIGSSWSDVGVLEFISLKDKYGEKYQNLINEVTDMLTELSNRVDSTDIEVLQKIRNNFPTYNNSISGYAELFTPWFNFVKSLLEQK